MLRQALNTRCEVVGDDCIVQSDSLKEALLASVKVSNLKVPASLSIYAGHKVALHNTGPSDLTLKKGFCLFGFGHGAHLTFQNLIRIHKWLTVRVDNLLQGPISN